MKAPRRWLVICVIHATYVKELHILKKKVRSSSEHNLAGRIVGYEWHIAGDDDEKLNDCRGFYVIF